MLGLDLDLEGDGAWPDLAGRLDQVIHLREGTTIRLAVLTAGMTSGRPAVGIRLDLPDGRVLVAETSARLLVTAARAIAARFPDLFEGGE